MTVAERTKAGLDSFKASKEQRNRAKETLGAISSLLRQAIDTPMPSLQRVDEAPQVGTDTTQNVENSIQSAPIQIQPAPTNTTTTEVGSASAQPMVQPTTQTETPTVQPTTEPVGEVNQQQPSMVIPRADSNYDPSKSKGIAMASFN